MRIDRWLWVIRIFKSRNLATEACRCNHVRINNLPVKPSKEITLGQIISVKLGPLEKVIKVEGFSERRLPASLAQKLLTDLTPLESYQKAKELTKRVIPRPTGKKLSGRPTKKQRRDLEDFLYPDT